jgi:hypothetical protein
MQETRNVPFACELPEDEQLRCAEAYRLGLFAHVDQLREREGGYSLGFRWDQQRIQQLGEFLAVDSACCAFLDHSLDIPRGKDLVWLHLTGPDGARDVLRDELRRIVPEPFRQALAR